MTSRYSTLDNDISYRMEYANEKYRTMHIMRTENWSKEEEKRTEIVENQPAEGYVNVSFPVLWPVSYTEASSNWNKILRIY